MMYVRFGRVILVLGICIMLVVYLQIVVLISRNTDRHTDRHTDSGIGRKRRDRHTDRHTDSGVDRKPQDRHTDRHTYSGVGRKPQDRHTDRHTYSGVGRKPQDRHQQEKLNASVSMNNVSFDTLNNMKYANFTDLIRKFLIQFDQQTLADNSPPLWQRELYNRTITQRNTQNFFLTQLLMVRLYSSDKAKWTIRELKQWMHYMFLIGIEHIYICDHFHVGDKNLEAQLVKYISLGLVTYMRISTHVAMTAQVQCYRHWLRRVRSQSSWMTSVDMDEYPYVVGDTRENCLQGYLHSFQQRSPNVGEIAMPNYLMLGQGDRTKDMVVDRIRRGTPHAANKLYKPIFQPEAYVPGIHRGTLTNQMKRVDADPGELRMLHYWGSRLQDWGPDTPQILNMTVPFSDMADVWAPRIRHSLLAFGETGAFSSKTGP